MRVKTRYVCEICGYDYKTEEEALECENRTPPERYPIGCIYGDASDTSSHHTEDMTFAVANIDIVEHQNESHSWACRDNGGGDSIDILDVCGGRSLRIQRDDVPDQSHPTFKRMVKLLRKFEIPISVWDGEKAVPYE